MFAIPPGEEQIMEFSNFDMIIARAKSDPRKKVMAVAAAEDTPVIQAALEAKADGITDVIFVGDSDKIKRLIAQENAAPEEYNIVHAAHEDAGQAAVSLIKDGAADFLMKGMMETKDMLRPVVKAENGLRTGRVMSHFALNEVPGYHKLIVNTDGGMVLNPTLEDKKAIIENAVATFHDLGYEMPKVAVLAGVEKVNPHMQETLDARALMEMNQTGEINGCIVEGPVSYDVAVNKEIACHKGAEYQYCGDYDVLVVPNMSAGNILGKCWSITAGARMAGIIVGAKVPVVLNSRGAPADEKYLSIALAAVAARGSEYAK